jgi:hypothetical protein
MTNVDKKNKSEEVQMHIKNSFDFINEHLPSTYTGLVTKKLSELGKKPVAPGSIRNIRSRGHADKSYQNLDVITALLEVAKDIERQRSGFITKAENIASDL